MMTISEGLLALSSSLELAATRSPHSRGHQYGTWSWGRRSLCCSRFRLKPRSRQRSMLTSPSSPRRPCRHLRRYLAARS